MHPPAERAPRRRGGRRALAALALGGGCLAAPAAVRAQEEPEHHHSLFERLNLDRLRLVAMGIAVGETKPTQIDRTRVYSLHADYGEIAPGFRVVFVATYWGSRYGDETLRKFEDTLRRIIREELKSSAA